MRKSHAFRPRPGDALEDRTVPSGGMDGLLGGLIASVPAQDAGQVLVAFQTFERTYNQDVRTILLPKGTTNPSANQAAFDQAVSNALSVLNTSIDSIIANLPTSANLSATVQSQLLGTGQNSLQGELSAIPSPTQTTSRAVRSLVGQSEMLIGQAASEVWHEVRTAPAPAGAIDAQTVRGDLAAVRTAFQAFSQAYNNDVKTILLPKGTTNPSANRAAFDQAVAKNVATLNTSVASALSNLPASVSASLATTVQADLLTSAGGTGGDLQSRLAALPTPTGTKGFAPVIFRFGSILDTFFAQGKVTLDILNAIRQYNTAGSGSQG